MNRRPLGPEPSALAGLSHAPNVLDYTPSLENLRGFSGIIGYNYPDLKKIIPVILFLLTLALAACSVPLPQAMGEPTPTASNPAAASPGPTTPPPAATATSMPTVMPTETSAPLGALSPEQRAALETAALAYVSPSPESAIDTAIRLDYIGRNANPATMCGPLTLAILRDAGLIDPSIPLINFYYLNPRPGNGEIYLREVFPPERFMKIVHEESVGKTDFAANPLFPGDFLYLFAGDSGSYEHMLVVSRVDEAGRAYSVTNLNTEDGVVIKEVMLYDPAQPGTGQFYDWTNWENRNIGRTGYGGFWLWRPLP